MRNVINITSNIASPMDEYRHQVNPIHSFASPPPIRPIFQAWKIKRLPIQSTGCPGKLRMKPINNKGRDTQFGTL
jgi:hypothetical protein